MVELMESDVVALNIVTLKLVDRRLIDWESGKALALDNPNHRSLVHDNSQ